MTGIDLGHSDTSRRAAPADVRATALGALERGTRTGLRLIVIFFAAWTLTYQLALVVKLGAAPTLAVGVTVTAIIAILVQPGSSDAWSEADRLSDSRLTVGALVVGFLVLALALLDYRGLAVGVLAVGAAGYLVLERLLARRLNEVSLSRPEPIGAPEAAPGLWLTGWSWALVCGVLSSVLARPDGDDAYFVNLSEWVADRGTFPLRDTMISDQVFPAPASHTPPVHSIEALLGTVSRLTGTSAGSFTYVVMTPVLTALAVLSLTWLVQVCRLRLAPLGLSAAVVFLLMSGSGASFGNFFAVRMWQGKSVLATVAIPLLTACAIDYIRRGGSRRAILTFLAVVAAVGASNTAVFLVPVLLGGLIVGAYLASGVRRAAGLVAALVYPAVCGFVIIFLAPAKESRTPAAADVAASSGAASLRAIGASPYLDPLVAVPGHGGVLVATLLATALGWLGLQSRAARTTVVAVVLAAAVALLPPVTKMVSSSAGVSSVVWRMWWVVPVPLLVAGLVSAAALVPLRGRSVVAAAVGAVAALLPVAGGGSWIGSPANGARWVAPVDWKTPPGAEASARLALKVSKPGDVVLAPWDTSRVLADMSVDVHPVSARTFYLSIYAGIPAARAQDRLALQTFVDSRTPSADVVAGPLRALSVDTACVGPQRGRAVDLLKGLGYRVAARNAKLVCLRR